MLVHGALLARILANLGVHEIEAGSPQPAFGTDRLLRGEAMFTMRASPSWCMNQEVWNACYGSGGDPHCDKYKTRSG